ncbi:hypothetical protein CHLV4139_07985 [Campylobacter helveticus]|uniref:hypothetical protein n=1 Tax=Campylobacter helveticus TaxID=28898 RepID=UPI00214BBE38|nr:hypothetical protein [Campylobacter helveticus]MCR2055429.1 hypothetical protein [Campylobacter helveticus]
MTKRFNFWNHFDEAYKHLQDKHKSRLTDDKLVSFASEIALKLVEIDFKEKENSYSYEKAEAEIKNLILQSKTQNEALQIEKLKSLVQAHAMLLSVGDNAAINKANAIVSFLNVVGNASNEKMVASYTTQVMELINQISNKDMSEAYKPLLEKLQNAANEGLDEKRGVSEVGIFAPRTKLKINEAVELKAYTMYPNNAHYFELNEKAYLGTSLFFISEDEGEFEVFFKALNHKNELLQTSIKLRVEKGDV